MTKFSAVSDNAGGTFAAIDAKDAAVFVSFLTEDAVFVSDLCGETLMASSPLLTYLVALASAK